MRRSNDNDTVARLFFLGGAGGTVAGTIAGWLYYKISGALVGAVLGALVGVIALFGFLLATRSGGSSK